MKNKLLNIVLWIAQVLLSLMFILAGGMKLFTPIADLAGKLPWVVDLPQILVRSLGFIDLLAGIGIILPFALKIKPKLMLWAALGIILIMISAIVFHILRGEESLIGINLVLIFLALFVYWFRSREAAFIERK